VVKIGVHLPELWPKNKVAVILEHYIRVWQWRHQYCDIAILSVRLPGCVSVCDTSIVSRKATNVLQRAALQALY